MRFEKITDNKIRIIFNLDDLSAKNIDFHSFMANSEETHALFLDMLDRAEKEIGFVTKDYKLMIEVLATSDGNFVLTVTRTSPEIFKSSPRKLYGKKKVLNTYNNSLIYKFNSFEDLCKIGNVLDDVFIKKLNKTLTRSSLYLLNSNYYLVLKYAEYNEDLKRLLATISEFSCSRRYNRYFEIRLLEYGKAIIKNKTFEKIKKYFD